MLFTNIVIHEVITDLFFEFCNSLFIYNIIKINIKFKIYGNIVSVIISSLFGK